MTHTPVSGQVAKYDMEFLLLWYFC